MIRATYADLKPELARIAGVSGMSISDPRVMAYTNLATIELMNEWDWPQLIVRMHFKVTTNILNVPSEFDRILSLNVNDVPQPIQSPWFEFVGYGPGFPTVLGSPTDQLDSDLLGRLEGVLDREDACTFQDIPSDGTLYYPALYATDPSDAGATIILQGYDQNGQWIRSNDPVNGWQDGVSLTLVGGASGASVVSTQVFSAITAVQKPVTNTYISVYCSSTKQSNFFLGEYTPYDTRPYYRRYKMPNLTNGQTYRILARLRKRYAPIVNLNDFLIIPNLAALSTMVQAVYYRESENIPSYTTYKQIAVDILKKETTAYIGKQRQKPLITCGEGFGVRQDGLLIL